MNERIKQSGAPVALYRYAICVEEHLDVHWSAWFDGMSLRESGDGTILEGPVADQAALHGLLAKLRNLNLTLISVRRLAPVGTVVATAPQKAPE
jgi:hypothetical protein